MDLINERVEHIIFGTGVIIEVNNNKITVRFQNETGEKIFLYPDAFERFLKAVNTDLQDNVIQECKRKHEEAMLEHERIEKEREAAELEVKKAKQELAKEKAAAARTKKKKSEK